MVTSLKGPFTKSTNELHIGNGQNDQEIRLRNLTFRIAPLTNPYKDSKGRTVRLWKASSQGFFGTVSHIDGRVTFISLDKITTPCNPKTSFKALQRISLLGQRQWNLVYLEAKDIIEI